MIHIINELIGQNAQIYNFYIFSIYIWQYCDFFEFDTKVFTFAHYCVKIVKENNFALWQIGVF